jgi:sec-independent protein translocase protein TatB
MFEFSGELLLILLVALIVLGPSKLPDVFRMLGKGMAEIRRLSLDVKSTLQQEIERVDELKRIEESKRELFGDDADKGPAETAAEQQPAKVIAPEPDLIPVAPPDASQVAAAEPAQTVAAEPAQAAAPAPDVQAQISKTDKPEDPSHA